MKRILRLIPILLLSFLLIPLSSCHDLSGKEDLWKELHSSAALSSTYLLSAESRYEQNYHPNYILDNDPATAWVEGVAGDGEGAEIEWSVSSLPSAQKLRLDIRNGYQKSDVLLMKNAAPAKIRISVFGSDGSKTMEKEFDLKKEMGWQSLIMELGFFSRGSVEKIRLKVLTVHPGSVYHDTCISDIKSYVISTVPYKPELEKKKLEAVLSWKKGRAALAKTKGQINNGDSLRWDEFDYEERNSAAIPPEHQAEIKLAESQIEKFKTNLNYFQLILPRKKTPDSASDIYDHAMEMTRHILHLPVFDSKAISLFEAQSSTPYSIDGPVSLKLSAINRETGKNGETEFIGAQYIYRNAVGRSSYEESGSILFHYSSEGKLKSVYRRIDSHSYDEGGYVEPENTNNTQKANEIKKGFSFTELRYKNKSQIVEIHKIEYMPSMFYNEPVNKSYIFYHRKPGT
jgi:hypothetical protein